jgi:hypothetical protein
MQVAVNLAGFAALVLIGAISAWYAGEGSRKRAPTAAPATLPDAGGAGRA